MLNLSVLRAKHFDSSTSCFRYSFAEDMQEALDSIGYREEYLLDRVNYYATQIQIHTRAGAPCRTHRSFFRQYYVALQLKRGKILNSRTPLFT